MIEYYVDQASSFAADIDSLFTWITIIVGFWFILVELVVFYFIAKFRKKPGVPAKYITGEKHHETKWVHWPHYAVIVCDVVIIAWTVLVWMDIKQDLPVADQKIRVIGQQWSWIFVHPGPDGQLDTADDISTVNDLHVQKGVTYHYELQSKDVLHSFSIPAFRMKQDSIPGRIVVGWFQPTKTGQYDVQCAEMCGIAHGIMAARVTIETQEEHQQWMASMSDSQVPIAAALPEEPASDYATQLARSF